MPTASITRTGLSVHDPLTVSDLVSGAARCTWTIVAISWLQAWSDPRCVLVSLVITLAYWAFDIHTRRQRMLRGHHLLDRRPRYSV